MKKVTLLCAMLLAVSAVGANAAGLSLNWNNCFADGRFANKNSTCLSNLGSAGTMVGTFDIPNDVVGATGIELVLDLASAGTTLPAWWTTSCRVPFTMNATISGTAVNCFDWSSGTALGGLAAYTIGGVYGPSSARVLAGFAVPPPGVNVAALAVAAPGAEYFAFNIVLSNAKTTGTGSCAGCLVPVCLSFNNLKMVAGTATAAIVNTPQSPASNTVTWQGGAGVSSTLGGGCPAATPTRNATWGSVKSLYR